MIFEEVDKRTGKKYVICSKYWPDGSRLRRRCTNKTLAKQLLVRIESAIALGTWSEMKRELTEGPRKDLTIREFSKVYLADYCRSRNTRPDFKEETLRWVNEIVGDVRLRDFRRSDAQRFENVRGRSVSGSTVNRGLSVLSNMLTFAFKQGLIESHPMALYGRIPEDEKVLRVMEPAEERRVVEEVLKADPVVGAYVGILGETGLRMTEGLGLEWSEVRIGQKQLTVSASKDYRVRYVPLSAYAIELLRTLPRIMDLPQVFVRMDTMQPLKAPRRPLYAGRKAAGLPWVGFHDFRHYRATQWIKNGVDIRTVQEWMGHKDIKTTMRYLHFADGPSSASFQSAERLELAELAAPVRNAVGDI